MRPAHFGVMNVTIAADSAVRSLSSVLKIMTAMEFAITARSEFRG